MIKSIKKFNALFLQANKTSVKTSSLRINARLDRRSSTPVIRIIRRKGRFTKKKPRFISRAKKAAFMRRTLGLNRFFSRRGSRPNKVSILARAHAFSAFSRMQTEYLRRHKFLLTQLAPRPRGRRRVRRGLRIKRIQVQKTCARGRTLGPTLIKTKGLRRANH